MDKFDNNYLFSSHKKRNTIEISSSKALILIGNFINSKDINIKCNNKIINNSFVLWENEYNRHEIILPEIISFSNIQNKNINLPLYKDKEFLLKELNYGILSYQQKQNDLNL